MGLTTMNNDRTILITGKTGTGKSTKALTFVNDPIVLYANDIDFDVGSIFGSASSLSMIELQISEERTLSFTDIKLLYSLSFIILF